MSLVEIKSGNKPPTVWYYRGFDSNDGRMSLSPQETKDDDFQVRIAPTTIESIRKLTIDRLGFWKPVEAETRTWRGAACT